MKKIVILSLGFLLFLLISITPVFAGAQVEVEKEEKTVVFLRPMNDQMDPAILNTAETALQTNCVYDGLAQYTKEGEVIPGLAESWEVSDDAREFTFHIRKGVKFQDGTMLDAHAVKFNFDRIFRLGRLAVGTYLKNADENTCKVIGDYTVKFTFDNPYPLFIKEISGPYYYSIASPDYIKKHTTSDDPDATKWMAEHACGTGPFELVEVLPGQRFIFKKYEDHWGGRTAQTDKMIFEVVPDPTIARLMLERGDADIAEKLLPEHLTILEETEGVKVEAYPIPKIVYKTYDVTNPPFDDINVRKAIEYAIDYEEIISKVEKGYAERLRSMIPSEFPAADPNLGYTYDPAKAKEYIKASKYPDGFTTDLIFSHERRVQFEQVALYMQRYLREIGIDVNIQKLAFSTQLATMEKGDYGMSLMQWGPSPDPQEQIGWLGDMEKGGISGWNASYYRNKEVEQSLRQGERSIDPEKRKMLFRKADQIIMEQAIYVPLYVLSETFAMRENIYNFHYSIFNRGYFWLIEKR